MHSNIAKAIFITGAKNRNPSLWNEYDRLKSTEWLSLSQLRNIQLERARKFFDFVGKHSYYYKKVFIKKNFSASRFDSIDSLKIIPSITKSQLIKNNNALHSDYDFGKSFIAETSGTTGNALKFKKNEQWDSINRANLMRAYDWYGVKPWDRCGYFRGYDIAHRHAAKVKFMDLLQNRFRIFSYDSKSIEEFSSKLESATYMAGYSSMIYQVAKLINALETEKPRVKLIKGTSEMILDVYQPEVINTFGSKIVSEYGAAESGLIAFECPAGNMHINLEDVILEIGDDDEILVTNLASYSFPIIRYQLGDAVKLSNKKCKCGRAHPIIKEIVGRKGPKVVGNSGIYPALTFYYVFKNLAIHNSMPLNYKVVQNEKGRVGIFIEGSENSRHESSIMNELCKYFGQDIIFSVKFVKYFNHQGNKTQYFESTL